MVMAVLRRWSGMDRRVMTSRELSGSGARGCMLLWGPAFVISIITSIFWFSRSKLLSIFSRMLRGFLPERSFLITWITLNVVLFCS